MIDRTTTLVPPLDGPDMPVGTFIDRERVVHLNYVRWRDDLPGGPGRKADSATMCGALLVVDLEWHAVGFADGPSGETCLDLGPAAGLCASCREVGERLARQEC